MVELKKKTEDKRVVYVAGSPEEESVTRIEFDVVEGSNVAGSGTVTSGGMAMMSGNAGSISINMNYSSNRTTGEVFALLQGLFSEGGAE